MTTTLTNRKLFSCLPTYFLLSPISWVAAPKSFYSISIRTDRLSKHYLSAGIGLGIGAVIVFDAVHLPLIAIVALQAFRLLVFYF